jgi:hypothetical protein
MNTSRLERLAPLTGLVSVVLMIVGAGMFGVYDYLPPADKLQAIFSDSPTRVYLAGYIGTMSAFFLLWFAGSLFSALREREGSAARLSMVAFGGGAASGVALAAGYTIMVATGARAGAPGGISLAEAVTLYDFYGQVLGQMFAVTLAVFIGASSVVSLRTGMFPRWLGWASALIALGLLTPIAYAVLALALLWLLVVSIWLYRGGSSR